MTIEFQNTKKDFLDFYKYIFFKKQKDRIYSVFFLTIVISLVSTIGKENWVSNLILIIFVLTSFLTITSVSPYIKACNRLNRIIKSNPSFFEKKILTVSELGINIKSQSKSTLWLWRNIVSVSSDDRFIKIVFADKKSIMLIPKSSFSKESEWHELIQIIQNWLNDFLNSGETIQYFEPEKLFIEKAKPPYALGLFCLIPFWGGIIGIFFILYGFFKNRSKYLIIIGSIGVLLNILFYTYIHFFPL